MPLYPWLLALNDPEKPAGEVRGLGLVNWRDCIGEGGVQRAFMIVKEIIVLCLFSGCATAAVFDGGGFAARAAFGNSLVRFNSTFMFFDAFTSNM